jgi:L-seryl-tRNA(Ser) seleniumtransferase
LIDQIRRHPLMRAMRVDKTCLMVLERTLPMFRDPEVLRREHPTYRMMSTSIETLRVRAQALAQAIAQATPAASTTVEPSAAYLGSGSLPTEAIPSVMVTVSLSAMTASELARRLRMDVACVFGRIEDQFVRLDVRTLTDDQVALIAGAFGRIAS